MEILSPNIRLAAGGAVLAAAGALATGCGTDLSGELRQTSDERQELKDEGQRAADKLGEIVTSYCDGTYEAYRAGETKPRKLSGGNYLVGNEVGERGLITAVYRSKDGILQRSECQDIVGAYYFDSQADRDKAGAGKADPKKLEPVYLTIKETDVKEGSHWVVVADNGKNSDFFDEKETRVSFTVPDAEHAGQEVKDGLDTAERVTLGLIEKFVGLIKSL